MKESNRKYLEKYGFDVNISDDVAEEIKCYRGKLYRYARTHTRPECRRILEAWQKRYGFSSDAKNIFKEYICKMYKERGNSIPSPRLAAITIMDGSSVYNTKSGCLVLPDVVSMENAETKEERLDRYNGYGIEDNNGELLLGVMYCYIDPAKVREILQKDETLCDYALRTISAPGTGVADRMGDWGIMCFSDIVRFFKYCYKEDPDGWIYDGVEGPFVYEARIEYNGDKERINRYLTVEPSDRESCQGEDETITVTARFENGFQCDVKCCGVQYREGESNLSWTEAVLFDKKGAEVACSEPDSQFFKTWAVEYEGDLYKVHVS